MLKQKLKSDQNYNLSIYRSRSLLYYLSTYYYWGLPNFLFVSLIIKKKMVDRQHRVGARTGTVGVTSYEDANV